jgi:hypothetical protein
MPGCGFDNDNARFEKAKRIHAELIAKGLNPRSNKFHKVFCTKMKRY